MSFIDWEFFKGGSTTAHHLDQLNPISFGAGSSLRLATSGTGDRTTNFKVTDGSGIPHGYTHGRIRSLFRVSSYTAGFCVGLTCMQSTDNITSTGNFYWAMMRRRDSLGINFRIVLAKYTGGLTGSSLVLDETFNFQSSLGTVFALELEWDASSETETDLIVRFDNNTLDFNSLNEVLTYTDTTAPYLTTIAEGVATKALGSLSEQYVATLDKTELYEIIP